MNLFSMQTIFSAVSKLYNDITQYSEKQPIATKEVKPDIKRCHSCDQTLAIEDEAEEDNIRPNAEGQLLRDTNPRASKQSSSACLLYAPPVDEFTVISNKPAFRRVRLNSQLEEACTNPETIQDDACHQCTDQMITKLDTKIDELLSDCTQYEELLVKLQKEYDDGSDALDNWNEINDDAQYLHKILCEIESITDERIEIDADWFKDRMSSEHFEYNFINQRNKRLMELAATNDQIEYNRIIIKKEQDRLARLNTHGLFGIAFIIDTRHYVSKINRLSIGFNHVDGRLYGSWPETNAAFGQVTLLIEALRRYYDFTFEDYKLVPMCSQSTIECLTYGDDNERITYPLYCFKFATTNHNFDRALICLLNCVAQLEAQLIKAKATLSLPNPLTRKGIVEGPTGRFYFIKTKKQNTEASWTKAMKLLLIDLSYMQMYTIRKELLPVGQTKRKSSSAVKI